MIAYRKLEDWRENFYISIPQQITKIVKTIRRGALRGVSIRTAGELPSGIPRSNSIAVAQSSTFKRKRVRSWLSRSQADSHPCQGLAYKQIRYLKFGLTRRTKFKPQEIDYIPCITSVELRIMALSEVRQGLRDDNDSEWRQECHFFANALRRDATSISYILTSEKAIPHLRPQQRVGTLQADLRVVASHRVAIGTNRKLVDSLE
ncbi:uncharacterized protein HD556DRAFT_1313003 [Suillus plorans]|uniref:Uncharacterized protein n=1 Tax=Suillus plorans TaxID=116603 RepID=A0A9P7DBW2_9AGAM|nr:uncharacterized protein HD556DRAFT_1313003 [Suillus plorans]KAG1787053.1 hypothetical protein HD556DRAFT_1313003 [Suillus plorans]